MNKIKLLSSKVQAGFPSPADDYLDKALDLNELLILNPPATFFMKVQGDSMIDIGIYDDDLLIVDRSIPPREGHVVIASLDGEFTVKRYIKKDGEFYLKAENKKFPLLKITEDMDFSIWGVVKNVIHNLV